MDGVREDISPYLTGPCNQYEARPVAPFVCVITLNEENRTE